MTQRLTDLFHRMRDRFPAIQPANSGGYTFFDNAAGAQLPQEAIDRVAAHLTRHNAQKGSVFTRQDRMQLAIYDLRAACADLMGTTSDRMALGLNATSLTAMIAHHLGRDLKAGDLLLTTELDHMANVWPWEELRSRGVLVEAVPIRKDGHIDLDGYRHLLERRPRLVACGWVSNATGVRVDVTAMARLAHEAGALLFVDCVAGAPHLPMAVTEWDVDFAVCSAYKIFGPHLGMAYVNPARLEGWQLGAIVGQDAGRYGLGTAYAAKLELGTQNHEGVAGFSGTLAYLEELGTEAAALRGAPAPTTRRERFLAAMEAIGEYEQGLTSALLEAIRSIPGVIIYGDPTVPILSFNLKGRRPAEVARHLEQAGFEARTGNYLAIPSMVKLASDFEGEAVRASLVHYNTVAEIERFAAALRSL